MNGPDFEQQLSRWSLLPYLIYLVILSTPAPLFHTTRLKPLHLLCKMAVQCQRENVRTGHVFATDKNYKTAWKRTTCNRLPNSRVGRSNTYQESLMLITQRGNLGWKFRDARLGFLSPPILARQSNACDEKHKRGNPLNLNYFRKTTRLVVSGWSPYHLPTMFVVCVYIYNKTNKTRCYLLKLLFLCFSLVLFLYFFLLFLCPSN